MKHPGWICMILLLITGPLAAQEPQFIIHDVGEANTATTILTMCQDHYGMIWLGTEQGLARYTGVAWQPVSLPGDHGTLEITALAEDSRKQLWIGTGNGMIFYGFSTFCISKLYISCLAKYFSILGNNFQYSWLKGSSW